jgi:hypothetical protein
VRGYLSATPVLRLNQITESHNKISIKENGIYESELCDVGSALTKDTRIRQGKKIQ